MKKVYTSIAICLIVCISMICLIGCSNEFAEKEYNDNAKIAQNDKFSKQSASFNQTGNDYIGNGYYFTASKFDGRETLWRKNIKEYTGIEIQIDLSISSGNAKVVFIDSDNNVTVLVECVQDSSTKQSTTITLNPQSGLSKLKIVGYGCKSVKLDMHVATIPYPIPTP